MSSNSFVRAERTFHLRFHWYRAWATMSCIPLRGISVTTEVVTPVRLVATRIVRLEHKVISILAWVRTRRWSYPHRGHYAFGLMQINTARKICWGGDALSGIDVLKKVFWVRSERKNEYNKLWRDWGDKLWSLPYCAQWAVLSLEKKDVHISLLISDSRIRKILVHCFRGSVSLFLDFPDTIYSVHNVA